MKRLLFRPPRVHPRAECADLARSLTPKLMIPPERHRRALPLVLPGRCGALAPRGRSLRLLPVGVSLARLPSSSRLPRRRTTNLGHLPAPLPPRSPIRARLLERRPSAPSLHPPFVGSFLVMYFGFFSGTITRSRTFVLSHLIYLDPYTAFLADLVLHWDFIYCHCDLQTLRSPPSTSVLYHVLLA